MYARDLLPEESCVSLVKKVIHDRPCVVLHNILFSSLLLLHHAARAAVG